MHIHLYIYIYGKETLGAQLSLTDLRAGRFQYVVVKAQLTFQMQGGKRRQIALGVLPGSTPCQPISQRNGDPVVAEKPTCVANLELVCLELVYSHF